MICIIIFLDSVLYKVSTAVICIIFFFDSVLYSGKESHKEWQGIGQLMDRKYLFSKLIHIYSHTVRKKLVRYVLYIILNVSLTSVQSVCRFLDVS